MKYLLLAALFIAVLIVPGRVVSQNIQRDLLHKQWAASWIEVAGEPSDQYGVYLFRKKINLSSKPSSYTIHVSADNRYKLFINEKLVSLGPARNDIGHWNFETVDIAQWLHRGENVIGAIVWNEAQLRPEAQISLRTGLIVQGDAEAGTDVNTNSSWKGIRNKAYKPLRPNIPNTYYVSGPGELVHMSEQPRNWMKPDFDESSWKNAEIVMPGNPKNIMGPFGIPVGWLLVPSMLPQMELKTERIKSVREAEGINVPASFPAEKSPVTIPANTVVNLLLDQGYLTNAYASIHFSAGKDASISIGYAESLYTNYPEKGNRNETEGKHFVGRRDSIISDGSANQQYTTLTWRTYRYLQLHIVTRQEPLMLDDIYGTFTGYPFELKAKFESDNGDLSQIMQTGWRTARLCAVETYMDCPYYEQLQYIGDARIQALISLFNSGDDRLVRNALNLMDNSRTPEGITESRHPSYSPQYIPTFSLWYIGMLRDYWMYGADTIFIKNKLPGARDVLNYFHKFQQDDGSLKHVPYWMFSDWVEKTGWVHGVAPAGKDSSSSIIDLQLLLAYQAASDMEQESGIREYASLYNKYAAQLKATIRKKYWDSSRGLFADQPEKESYSQHANALAILAGVVAGAEANAIAKKILSDTSLAPASIYFKYYLHRALVKAGLGNDYIQWLDVWRQNLKMGLTTWAEMSDINGSRSDCHAWGSSPNIEFFRTVLGIDSDAPGFTKVKIEPRLGSLTNAKGEMPHPNGVIAAQYVKQNNKWSVSIDLPVRTSGSLIWRGKSYPLKAGKNAFNF
ncbi:MAG: alpha-rhamnosidase [Chitinophagaceae bacterium]|nr:alpha-rhamnosidase [Chitinophagaceae bacterium]